MALLPRQYVGNSNNNCYDGYGNAYGCQSGWYNWGRWVVLGIIVVVFFLLFFICSCLSARRRKRANRVPIYGTGWAGRTPFGHGQAQYNPNYPQQEIQPPYNNTQSNAPPAYNQTSGGYYGQNQGYFGGQQTGTELQEPTNSYRAAENVYQAPTGPPPKKGDGIV